MIGIHLTFFVKAYEYIPHIKEYSHSDNTNSEKHQSTSVQGCNNGDIHMSVSTNKVTIVI